METTKKKVPLRANNEGAKKINDDDTATSRKKNNAAQKPKKRAHRSSPFLLYSLEHRERIQKEHPTASYSDIARLVHAAFTKQSKNERRTDHLEQQQTTSSALIVATPNDFRTVVVNDRLDTIFEEVRQLYNNNQSKQLEQTIKPRVLYSLQESITK
eukprot:CAMPEP_0170976970 /NCGR_PEP_ID=MMETSP0736-20130129/275_1 /TAXON_ID=186038 /ORGANISM="Fragilariopsis kerguelensis, Strain L26-C5" /LENGTH=156 /DNA_ID=CAMNT_0011398959 /DNA_START=39 /DNA_END=506 /DNA_ORIENTATION=+